ncbi:MAG: tRNA (adenosine(37)-N6)-dimethylallyltransferase MiaA [Candidatus Xenobiia bacterium LiM19]
MMEKRSGSVMKVVAIVGPNASGKSDLGIAAARQFNGEVLSADSRQIYHHMDLGTGKVCGSLLTGEKKSCHALGRDFDLVPLLCEGVKHWLIDIVEPQEHFTVAEYQKLAMSLIGDIGSRAHLPFMVGGTGLYVRAVLEGLSFPPQPSQPELRKELEKLCAAELRELLQVRDRRAGDFVDLNNPRRMIRALEVLSSPGASLEQLRKRDPVPFESLTVGIRIEREELKKRIYRRLVDRLERGMVEEVEKLLDAGISPERMESFGLEYRYIYRYCAGRLKYQEMVELLYQEICRFAKRQYTWFRKYGNVHWITTPDEAFAEIARFLQ